MNDEDNSRYVASVEKRSGPGNDGGAGTGEAATIEDIDDPRDDQGPGDPQAQVAMET